MNHLSKIIWLPLLALVITLLNTGCATPALRESNRAYAKESREFRSTGRSLSGSYIGIEKRKGSLSEVYQFESPFGHAGTPKVLEVVVPVYGITASDPVQAYESGNIRVGVEKAELWFWKHNGMPEKQVAEEGTIRRVDISWNGKSNILLRRYLPKAGCHYASGKELKLRIPWNRRSRITYGFRNLAYVATVPYDVAMGCCVLALLIMANG